MSEKFMITVHIPCKKHVKKYLLARYGSNHTMTKTSFLGTLLFHVLDKNCPKSKYNLEDFDSRFDILIPEFYFKTRGFEIGYKKRHYLAVCFEKMFMEDMLLSIRLAHQQYHVKPIEAMRRFLKMYHINENDVNFDTLYRQYQREKNENKAA